MNAPLSPQATEIFPPIGRRDPAFPRIVVAFFLGGFATFALLYCVQPLLPVFAREFSLTPAGASFSLSIPTLVMAPAMIVAGSVSDAFGRKRVMVVSLTAAALATVAASLASDWKIFLALRALTGLALSGLPAVAMAYLADELEASALGFAMGLYIAGSTLGGLFGRLVVAIVADYWNWRVAMLTIAAREPRGRLVPRARAAAGAHLRSQGAGCARPHRARYAQHFSDPGLRLLFAAGFLALGSFVCTYNYIGFRLAAPPFSFSPTTIGFVFVLYLVGAVSSTVMGELAGRFGRRRVIWIAALIELVGVAVTLPDNIFAVIFGVALITWGFFGVHSIASSWVGLRAPNGRAQATALYLFFYYLGSTVAGSAGGWFFLHWGWPGVVAFLSVMVLAALWVALKLSKVPPPRHLQKT